MFAFTNGSLECGEPTADISASMLAAFSVGCMAEFSQDDLDRMEAVLDSANLTDDVFTTSQVCMNL